VLCASSEWSEIRLDLSDTASGRKHKDAVSQDINIVVMIGRKIFTTFRSDLLK